MSYVELLDIFMSGSNVGQNVFFSRTLEHMDKDFFLSRKQTQEDSQLSEYNQYLMKTCFYKNSF